MAKIVYSSSKSLRFFEPVLERLLCPFIGLVELRLGGLPGQPDLGHQSANVAFTVPNAELLDEVVSSQWNRPRRRVNTGFLRRSVENIHELLVLLIGEFGWPTGSWFVVDDGLERLSFEPFETIEPLRGSSFRRIRRVRRRLSG